MEKFDYNKTYYKVTNEEECHHNFQYQDGLNIDTIPFNDDPKESCVPGGFYFTDLEHIVIFFNYGCWIREIKIPKDAIVIKDPENDKWRANKIILGKKYNLNDYFNKLWNPDKFNWNYSEYLAEYCSEHFDKWWNPKKFDWYYSYCLAQYCSEYFDKWWNPEKFNWYYSWYLAENCSEYKSIWENDYNKRS